MAGRPIYAHVWAAISMRAMPENEIPPALPGDDYLNGAARDRGVGLARRTTVPWNMPVRSVSAAL